MQSLLIIRTWFKVGHYVNTNRVQKQNQANIQCTLTKVLNKIKPSFLVTTKIMQKGTSLYFYE